MILLAKDSKSNNLIVERYFTIVQTIIFMLPQHTDGIYFLEVMLTKNKIIYLNHLENFFFPNLNDHNQCLNSGIILFST